MSGEKKMTIAGGLAALGAGAYYLLGPKGKEHQKKTKELMDKIKKEAEKEIKKAKKVTVPVYHKAVDLIAENYGKQYKIHEKEIKAIAKKLKSEWEGVTKKSKSK